jgi:hypothetical protein
MRILPFAHHASSQAHDGENDLTNEDARDDVLDGLKHLALCLHSLFDTMLRIFPSVALSSIVEEIT